MFQMPLQIRLEIIQFEYKQLTNFLVSRTFIWYLEI